MTSSVSQLELLTSRLGQRKSYDMHTGQMDGWVDGGMKETTRSLGEDCLLIDQVAPEARVRC